MFKKLVTVLSLLLVTLTVQAQDDEAFTLMFEDLERTYVLHVPDDLDDPAPLVILLHGRFGDGVGMAEYTQFNTVADEEGFIAAYPDGVNGEWNFIEGIQGYPDAHDDVAFLHALVAHIGETQPVDLTRVYLGGFSNGGFMTQRVACENPSGFAAFLSVGAAGFGGMLDVCLEAGTETAPILMINGTADADIPWRGINVTRGDRTVWIAYPVPETLAYWAEFNSCENDAETEETAATETEQATLKMTVVCDDDASTVLYAIKGGEHEWLTSANEMIWDFFRQHADNSLGTLNKP